MKLNWTLVLFGLSGVICAQHVGRREDVINDWIRRIREAPKGHSMSPSWSSKSRIPVIGVGELPLQNEAEVSAARVGPLQPSPYQSQDRPQQARPAATRPSPFNSRPFEQQPSFNSRNEFNFRAQNPEFSSRPSAPEFNSRPSSVSSPFSARPPRESSPQPQSFDQFGPPRSRSQENRPGNVPPFSFDDTEIEFPSFGSSSQYERPKRQNQKQSPFLSQIFPEPFSQKEVDENFSTGFFGGQQQQTFRKTPPTQRPESLEEEEEDEDFEVEVRPIRQPQPPSQLRHRGPQTIRPPIQEERPFPIRSKEPPNQFFRPKPKSLQRFRGKPKLLGPVIQRPFNNGPSVPRHRASQGPVQYLDEPEEHEAPHARLDDFTPTRSPAQTPPTRSTTERPIPTPGPGDFPPMPPPRPTVPTVPPTHPPPITHPPSHYLPASYLPSNKLESSHFDDDYDVDERNDDSKEGNGFFDDAPSGFPSLESMSNGFESMKIRNKRSAKDLDAGEQRYRRRQFANPTSYNEGRHRRQQNVGTGNNDYSFQQNFWDDVDIDTRDFFNPQPTPQVQQHQQGDGSQNGYGQRQRPFKSGNYQSYTQGQAQPNRYLQQYNRDPYPQQSIQSYPDDGYSSEGVYNKYDVVQNEILGSGNFDVIRGGTFYDDDAYHQPSSNRKPHNHDKGNFLENFRDFADIKGEYEYNKK